MSWSIEIITTDGTITAFNEAFDAYRSTEKISFDGVSASVKVNYYEGWDFNYEANPGNIFADQPSTIFSTFYPWEQHSQIYSYKVEASRYINLCLDTVQNGNLINTSLGFYFSSNTTGHDVLIYQWNAPMGYYRDSEQTVLNKFKLGAVMNDGYIGSMLTDSLGKTLYVGFNIDDVAPFGAFEHVEVSDQYGEESTEEGYGVGASGVGSFDNSSDTIGIPDVPVYGISNSGFVNIYKTTSEGLQRLGDDLFPDFEIPNIPTPTEASVEQALETICEALNAVGEMAVAIGTQFVNDKLINYVIDCHLIPVSPNTGGSERIKIGFKTMTQTGSKVSSDYVDFDCGTISIAEYYANFIDYIGTRAKLWLPFIGFIDLKPEYFQSGLLSVKYRFNVIDGSFMAYVMSSSSKSQLRNSVVGMFGGNACQHIPITGSNYASMISSVISGAGTVLSKSSGAVGMLDATSGALTTIGAKPDVQQSNGYNSTTSMLGIRYPYMIIEREVSDFSRSYTKEKGLPLNVTKSLKDCHGFTIASSLHLDGVTCTDTEKNMIEQALRNGVILP